MKTWQQFTEDRQEQEDRVKSLLLKVKMLHKIEMNANMSVQEIRSYLQQSGLGDALDAARIKEFLRTQNEQPWSPPDDEVPDDDPPTTIKLRLA